MKKQLWLILEDTTTKRGRYFDYFIQILILKPMPLPMVTGLLPQMLKMLLLMRMVLLSICIKKLV